MSTALKTQTPDSTSQELQDKLRLHTAKNIINEYAYCYKSAVLDILDLDLIVRISYIISYSSSSSKWSHDSPYIKIIQKNKDTNEYLGEIQDLNRLKKNNQYILNIGDKIWFKKENVIEISQSHVYEDNTTIINALKKMITTYKVLCTGPLFTIESESESESESDSDPSDSGSD